ncbi:hypothetical protein NL676_008689 [Syzygium grande]|nr:hypothetical protein NL676_008689 [Syzygium grande]
MGQACGAEPSRHFDVPGCALLLSLGSPPSPNFPPSRHRPCCSSGSHVNRCCSPPLSSSPPSLFVASMLTSSSASSANYPTECPAVVELVARAQPLSALTKQPRL